LRPSLEANCVKYMEPFSSVSAYRLKYRGLVQREITTPSQGHLKTQALRPGVNIFAAVEYLSNLFALLFSPGRPSPPEVCNEDCNKDDKC